MLEELGQWVSRAPGRCSLHLAIITGITCILITIINYLIFSNLLLLRFYLCSLCFTRYSTLIRILVSSFKNESPLGYEAIKIENKLKFYNTL